MLSCNSNDDNLTGNFAKSRASRIYLNAVKNSMNASNLNSSSNSSLCFLPFFPIEVAYSNGSKKKINSLDELKDALIGETKALHINKILFPFKVKSFSNNQIVNIVDEKQFESMLFNCEETKAINYYFANTNCFEFIYPISVKRSNEDILFFPNIQSMQAELNALSNGDYWVDFVYPFKIKFGDSEALIQDIWDFYNYVNCAPEYGCICTLNYNPVCVQTSNGILKFDNSCWAECAGFSPEDFVNCNNSNCECTEEYMPVCVQTSNGVIEFENQCKALCAGYKVQDFINCN